MTKTFYLTCLALPAIKQQLCSHNTHMPFTEADMVILRFSMNEELMSGLHMVLSFDGQTEHIYIKTLPLARLPLDSQHSPLAVHCSQIRGGMPK